MSRIRSIVVLGSLLGAFAAAPAFAQQDTTHKPGGLNKVAHDVSKTVKKAGRDTKAETKRAASGTHRTLKKAGNDTKAEAKRVTGVTSRTPDSTHKAGGLNKVARDVSHNVKQAGRDSKAETKRAASRAHKTAQKAGNDAKAQAKRTVGDTTKP